MFCCTLIYVPSSFAIILMGKRELVALLSLSSWCLVIVVWLFLAIPWVCLQFVIVVFPDHTHLLFLISLLSFWCLVTVSILLVWFPPLDLGRIDKITGHQLSILRLFLTLPWVGLKCVSVLLSGHTLLLLDLSNQPLKTMQVCSILKCYKHYNLSIP